MGVSESCIHCKKKENFCNVGIKYRSPKPYSEGDDHWEYAKGVIGVKCDTCQMDKDGYPWFHTHMCTPCYMKYKDTFNISSDYKINITILDKGKYYVHK